MRMIDIIEKKKQNNELTQEEIAYFVANYTNGNIPDYQASALAMAIYFNKMTPSETAILTSEMAKSGDMLDLSALGDATVDKHSSGGVGDKTTLIVAPIAAAASCTVAKMSGRGLGFTGGTIDKLMAIPNFSTKMSEADFYKRASDSKIVIASQTGNMVPCDKKLYALRDVTATVNSMPLVASSIMSKKIAAGSKNIVLDVKCGSGAFMQDVESATQLASEMVAIGKSCNRNISALVTNMDTPLGYAIGNTLEVQEAVRLLKGEKISDLLTICLELSSEMIALALKKDKAEAMTIAAEMLESGRAYDKLCEMVKSQGGDVKYIENEELLGFDSEIYQIKATADGYLSRLDALTIGRVSVLLGAGRAVKDDEIDYKAGILLNHKLGDKVNAGDVTMTLYSNSKNKINDALPLAQASFEIANKKIEKPSIIISRIS